MKPPAPNAIILLLVADPAMRTAMDDALREAGYLVSAAADLGTAVDRLKEMRFDLLITRPYVQSMPGHMAADYLRTKSPGLPVMIVGGFMEDDQVNAINEVELFHIFPKPFLREDLLAKVSEVLAAARGKHV
jgi:DNA-binding response OmpR family regulator